MKKHIVLALASAMLMSLVGCGSSTSSTSSTASSTQTAASSQTATAQATTSAAESAPSIDYPTKPVQLILPAKPGGDIDMNGRLLAKNIEKHLGQPMVPVNMPDGRGNVALQTLAESPADGYQFVYFNSVIITGGVNETMKYNYTDFIPVAITSSSQANVCVVAGDSKYNTITDLVEDAKANPNTVRFPVTLGANSHFQAVAFEQATGISLKKLDASSGGDKAVAILSGEMETYFTTYSPVKDYVESGKMKVIGVIGDERSELLPDVPTFKECGIDMGDEFNQAYCLYAQKDTPAEIIEVMQKAVQDTMNDPDCIAEFEAQSFVPGTMIGDDAKKYLDETWDFYSTLKEPVMNDTF